MARQSLNETVREDGLRIITKKMPYTKRTRVVMVAGSGSAYDPPEKDGLNHLFEHMAFKGTTSRPVDQLRPLLDRYCHFHNAYTDRLQTVYQAEGVYRHTETICDLMFDIYINSIFPANELEKEKEVVFNEITRDQDEDTYVTFFALWEMLWQLNPMRKFGVGTVPGVTAVTQDLLLETHRSRYVPSNTVVVGIGNIEHDLLVNKASWYLPVDKDHPRVMGLGWDDEHEEAPAEKERIIFRPGSEKACIALGQKIQNKATLSEREGLALSILEQMLDAMLFSEIRDKRGFAYTVGCRVQGDYQLGHYMSFSGETLPKRIADVKQLMSDVAYIQPLNRDRFSETREALLDKVLISTESAATWEKIVVEQMVSRGVSLSYARGLVARRSKLLPLVEFEEVLQIREKLLKPELAACAITQPLPKSVAAICGPDQTGC